MPCSCPITKGFPIVRDVKPGGVFLINCQWDFAELEHHLDAASKRYIANNDIQLYMINAIDLAREIGMGKRTNTILQSAFFTLAKVIPQEDAIRYMKEKATASYLKKGQDVVDMNHKAIDAGATAFVKVDVPESWKTAEDKAEKKVYTGREKTVEMVKTILDPVDKMDGDSCPFPLSSITQTAPLSLALPLTRSAAFPLSFPSGTPTAAFSATTVLSYARMLPCVPSLLMRKRPRQKCTRKCKPR